MSSRKNHFRLILFPVLGTGLAGWFLATINMGAELSRKGSIYSLNDLYKIILWHVLLWTCVGLIIGVVLLLLSLVFKKPRTIHFINTFTLLLFIAFWVFVFGHLNIHLLSGLFSWRSLLWNSAIFVAGAALFYLIYFSLQSKKKRAWNVCFMTITVILSLLTLFSVTNPWTASTRPSTQVIKKKQGASEKINVLFVLLDAVRADHLGCYGYPKNTTPNIDRLAAQGAVFEKAYAQSSHTLESVPSLLTSTYPSTHAIKTQTTALPDKLFTLPQFFKSAGYKTAIFSVNPYVSAAYGYHRGIDDFYWLDRDSIKINKTVLGYIIQTAKRFPRLEKTANALLRLGLLFYPQKCSLKSGDPSAMTAKAAGWIRKHHQDPFFLYLHYDGGHNPYISPYKDMFDPGYSGSPVDDFPEKMGMFYPYTKGTPLPKEKRSNLIAQYDGQIFYHDQCLDKLFKLLSELDIKDQTLVVLTSDHGEEFFEHEGWGHGQSVFEETIHVPLVFYSPMMIGAGQRIPHLVELVDIFPTLLDLCEIPVHDMLPYKIDGISLVSSFKQESPPPLRSAVLSELTQGGHSARCLRTEKYKVIEISAGMRTLRLAYDMEHDPGEKQDIYEKDNKQIQSLFSRLENILKAASNKAFKIKKTRLDEKQKEQLRSLGYLK